MQNRRHNSSEFIQRDLAAIAVNGSSSSFSDIDQLVPEIKLYAKSKFSLSANNNTILPSFIVYEDNHNISN